MRTWVRQSITQSLLLLIPFGVFTQMMLQSLSHIPLGDDRPDYLERNVTPTDSLNTRAIVGIATSIMFSLFSWLYLITSWRSRTVLQAEYDTSTGVNRGVRVTGNTNGSTDVKQSTTSNQGISQLSRDDQGRNSNAPSMNV